MSGCPAGSRAHGSRSRSQPPPLGPLAAGVLLSGASARLTIAVCAALGLVLAVWGTLGPAIRAAPSLAEPVEEPAPA